MSKRVISNGLIVLSLLAGASAHADERSSVYVGVGLGEATLKADDIDIGFNDSDTAFKLFAGVDFTKYFGVEAAYFDGGAPAETFTFAGFSGEVEAEISGFSASVVGRVPVSEMFTLFGKVGLAAYDMDVTARIDDISASDAGSDNDFSYGVGAALSFARTFELRAEYESIEVEGTFSMLSISGAYRF